MELPQHNASMSLMAGARLTSYAGRRCLPTAVGFGRGDLVTAHAIGDWKAPPGAMGAQNFAGCMPFRYNGLRSETAADIKKNVISAMSYAYKSAKALAEPTARYWYHMPKDLAVWSTCKDADGDTDAEEEQHLDIEGSDAEQDAPAIADPVADRQDLYAPVFQHPLPKRPRLELPPDASGSQLLPRLNEVLPHDFWAPKRRGPNSRKHYALRWESCANLSGPTEYAWALRCVCQKLLPRTRRGNIDATVIDLDTCDRCLSTGPVAEPPAPPWLSE